MPGYPRQPKLGSEGDVLTFTLGSWTPKAPYVTPSYVFKAGGSDPIRLDELEAPTDVTTLNASPSAHGLLRKLSNVATEFMNGQGNWAVPAGSGGGSTWSQDTGTPNTLAANAELTITHPSVTNEQLMVVVWRDVAQTGLTNTTLDFDFADVGNYTLENSTYTEFSSGKYQLKDTGGGTPVIATPLDRTTNSADILKGGEYGGAYSAYRVFDSSDTTTWFSYSADADTWVGFDFGTAKRIGKWRFIGRGAHWPATLSLDYSDNGTSWTQQESSGSQSVDTWYSHTFTAATHRYWRVKITASGNIANCELGQVEFWEVPPAYQINTWYYAHTTNTNRFSFTNVQEVNSVAHTVTTPSGTSVRVLVSFDGRSTWKKWNGSSWATHAGGLGDIANGNTTAEVATGLTNYTPGVGETGLDFAWGLHTTDATVTPSVDLVTINYDETTLYGLASVGTYGSTAEFGVQRVSSTTTKIKNQTGVSQKIHASVVTP